MNPLHYPAVNKILILGPCGTGKSTLAQILGEHTGLPLVHLDAHYWHPGWVESTRPEFTRLLVDLIAKPQWIMEGNYMSYLLKERVTAADVVIWMPAPGWFGLYRVIKRRFQWHNQQRPDMAEGCREKLDWPFIWWVISFNWRFTPFITRAFQDHPKVLVVPRHMDKHKFVKQNFSRPSTQSN